MERINLLSLTPEDLEKLVTDFGESRFRVKQIFDWIYKKDVYDFNEMTNLPKNFRKVLEDKTEIKLPQLLKKQVSNLDGTTKYLFQLADKEKIETVFMPHEKDGKITRRALCISSQVGCPIGCSFCATGKGGYTRNLSVSEIIGQLLYVQREEKGKITNIVFMGMGEPLLNYDNVLKSIRIMISEKCFDISARKITISTSGLVPQIKMLAEEGIPFGLAISIHSPFNKVRDKLVPINKKYPIEEVLDACKYFIEKTNRKVTFEYALIKGENDSVEDAEKLGKLLKGMLCNVNIIPVNKVCDSNFLRPTEEHILKFKDRIQKYGVDCFVRVERGSDIAAACGQLRGEYN